MSQKLRKAIVATVKIGNIEIEGLQFPDGSFGITYTQINSILKLENRTSDVWRKVKRLLGNEFENRKAKTEFNNNQTSYLNLFEFELLLAKLDRAGSIKAQNFRDELIGLSLQQLWSDAFSIKFEKEERQQWLSSRQQGKITRRTLTDAIKDYLEKNSTSSNYKKFVYSNCSDEVNRIVFGRSAKKLKEDWNCIDVRSAFTTEELLIVESLERLAIALIDRKNFEPFLAVKEAGERMLVEVITR